MGMKEAYEKKLQAQLDEWGAEIDKLKAKADKAEADAQLDYYKEIEELRTKLHHLPWPSKKRSKPATRTYQKIEGCNFVSASAWEMSFRNGIGFMVMVLLRRA